MSIITSSKSVQAPSYSVSDPSAPSDNQILILSSDDDDQLGSSSHQSQLPAAVADVGMIIWCGFAVHWLFILESSHA